jgi:hypothetical protein
MALFLQSQSDGQSEFKFIFYFRMLQPGMQHCTIGNLKDPCVQVKDTGAFCFCEA